MVSAGDVFDPEIDDVAPAPAQLAEHNTRRAVTLGVHPNQGQEHRVLEGQVGDLRGEFETRGLFKVQGDDRGVGHCARDWGVENSVADKKDF